MGVLHPTCRKNQAKNLGRHLELSEWRAAFTRNNRREKLVMRKAARMKHKVARVRSRLDELLFDRFNNRTAAVNAGFGVIGLQDSKLE